MKEMRAEALTNYSKERNSLKREEINAILDKGIELVSRADSVNSLSNGGSALFPHTYITQCGDQIAAVACASLIACKNIGKNQRNGKMKKRLRIFSCEC